MILSQKVKLTSPQLSLLNRGLNFIPTRGSNKNIKSQSKLDLQNYHRRLKLWAYYNNDDDISAKPPFTPASSWTPPDLSLPAHIRDLIKSDLDLFEKSFKIIRIKSNLTQEEKYRVTGASRHAWPCQMKP